MHTCFDSIHIKLFVTQKKYEIAACIINAWGYIIMYMEILPRNVF